MQALALVAIVGISAPIVMNAKLKIDLAAVDQRMTLKGHLKILELQQALLDESICTQNLTGHSVLSDRNVNSVNFLDGAGVLDTAKKILAPKYTDAAMTSANILYDGSNIMAVTLRSPGPANLVGVNAGDSVLAYLEIHTITNGVNSQNRIPIYIEFDSANIVNKCSASRRIFRC